MGNFCFMRQTYKTSERFPLLFTHRDRPQSLKEPIEDVKNYISNWEGGGGVIYPNILSTPEENCDFIFLYLLNLINFQTL